jgi:DNA-binding NarL/FixJ family response regulator
LETGWNEAAMSVSTLGRITVLLADDSRVVRIGFRRILELEDDLEVVGEAKNGLEAIAAAKRLRPSVVLMDITMPMLNGLQASREILDGVPATKVIIVSVHNDEAFIVEAMNCGASGYLLKQTCGDRLCSVIREVQKGNTFFSPSIAEKQH